jgi:hypothetical protein
MRWLIFAVVLAGCGQGVPATVTVGNPPAAAPAPLTAEETELAKWTPEQRALYSAARELIRSRLLEFPNVPAEWHFPIYIPPKSGEAPIETVGLKFSNVQSFAGAVTAGDNSGKRVMRKWGVVFGQPHTSKQGKLIPIMWQLGEKKETFLSLD